VASTPDQLPDLAVPESVQRLGVIVATTSTTVSQVYKLMLFGTLATMMSGMSVVIIFWLAIMLQHHYLGSLDLLPVLSAMLAINLIFLFTFLILLVRAIRASNAPVSS
jgi:hypothetical protein